MIVTNDLCEKISLAKGEKPFLHEIVSINHHMAHIASAYYLSGFDRSACLVLDANGTFYDQGRYSEIESSGFAERGKIYLTNTQYSKADKFQTSSLGHFYLFITYQCGFNFGEEGKVMGLAPYGDGRYVEILRKAMDPQRHNYMNEEIRKTVFELRDQNTSDHKFKENLAFAAQTLLEENLFLICNQVYERTKSRNLCYAGGLALNSVANGKLKRNTPFEEVFVFPAAGDGGTAVGAALYGYYTIGGHVYHEEQIRSVFWGKEYSKNETELALYRYRDRITYTYETYNIIYKQTAKALSRGKIVGWFQDGAETGPRALGNRSILTAPHIPNMKNILNAKVKFRESFRPFAPAILEEAVTEYFDTDFPNNPFMLFVGNVLPSKRDIIPAVTHIDHSARFQTVNQKDHPKFYRLIQEFLIITGIPVVLNTSFNIKGEPIVETPADAIKSFLQSDMDLLVIGRFVVNKKGRKLNE